MQQRSDFRCVHRLRMAGVPVDLEIYTGMVHGFIQFGRAVKTAMDCHGDAAKFIRRTISD